jgi:dolichyl-phosphate-mannose--protein O-mannosyl transferase
MEINKSLKSEQSILLNARKAVVITFIIFVIYIFFSSFLLGYGKDIYFGGWNILEYK